MVPGEAMANGAATGDEPDARPATAADAATRPTPAAPGDDPRRDSGPHPGPEQRTDANSDFAGDLEVGVPIADADGETIERLAGEVLRYLQRYPNAADTVEGIAQWWIARQRLFETRAHVRAALDRLVTRRLVEAAGSADGRSRYRLRRGASATAARAGDADVHGTAPRDHDPEPDPDKSDPDEPDPDEPDPDRAPDP